MQKEIPSTMSSYSELFARFNHTELYQTARAAGHNVSPAFSRESLIRILSGEEEATPVAHGVDQWRHGIMGFLLEYWRAVETQLTCPAKTKNPRACFTCLDQQVITCLVQNKNDIELIQLHKKDQ